MTCNVSMVTNTTYGNRERARAFLALSPGPRTKKKVTMRPSNSKGQIHLPILIVTFLGRCGSCRGHRRLFQKGFDFFEEQSVGAEGVAAIDGGLTIPVGERPSRLLEDGRQGGTIPCAHDGVEHDLGSTRGPQTKAIKNAQTPGW